MNDTSFMEHLLQKTIINIQIYTELLLKAQQQKEKLQQQIKEGTQK